MDYLFTWFGPLNECNKKLIAIANTDSVTIRSVLAVARLTVTVTLNDLLH